MGGRWYQRGVLQPKGRRSLAVKRWWRLWRGRRQGRGGLGAQSQREVCSVGQGKPQGKDGRWQARWVGRIHSSRALYALFAVGVAGEEEWVDIAESEGERVESSRANVERKPTKTMLYARTLAHTSCRRRSPVLVPVPVVAWILELRASEGQRECSRRRGEHFFLCALVSCVCLYVAAGRGRTTRGNRGAHERLGGVRETDRERESI